MTAPTRPLLRYHGGKWRIAPWIISHFPEHGVYVEPCAGAASVFMQKPRVGAEILNDLDGRIVALFRCLRDPAAAAELQRRLRLTPFARAEFMEAYEAAADEIDAARRLIVLSFMGHGTDSIGRAYHTGFRAKVTDSRALPSNEWSNWPDEVPAFVERLRGVTLECRDAVEVIERLDCPKTLFYVDPPYPASTRTSAVGKHGYRHEMTDDDHRGLAAALRAAAGYVVISGYGCDLYDRELYRDWRRVARSALADGAKKRTEVLWLSPRCPEQRQGQLL